MARAALRTASAAVGEEMKRLTKLARDHWPELFRHRALLPDVSSMFEGLPDFNGVARCAAIGWSLSAYEDREKISDGRHKVYTASLSEQGRKTTVCLKQIEMEGSVATKLQREVALLKKLRHENIVSVEACFLAVSYTHLTLQTICSV